MQQSVKLIKEVVVAIGNHEMDDLIQEEQNSEYEGVRFNLLNQTYRSRLAKSTSKKQGYFVVFWEKDNMDKNQPFTYLSSPDRVIVTVMDNEKIGQFIFPKTVLHKQGILSSEISKGKMAIRVYPSWISNLNPSAAKTQKWQVEYFVDLSHKMDLDKLTYLYNF
ncbi:MepB protein [Marinilactibacillus psychrotolerans]|uniref:MepB protein n=1 Tax=Marinilactibacillus psychrotolerans TaxID=191770 RepID=A0A5R9C5X8_9LACT|nr:MepB family protein [Marinilactibacillus psychrotolerans]TLQ08431.1 MepB protein [Marinilactibacillus psychrotolerans]